MKRCEACSSRSPGATTLRSMSSTRRHYRIREEVDQDANIILGATFDEEPRGNHPRVGGGHRDRPGGDRQQGRSLVDGSNASRKWPSACAPRLGPDRTRRNPCRRSRGPCCRNREGRPDGERPRSPPRSCAGGRCAGRDPSDAAHGAGRGRPHADYPKQAVAYEPPMISTSTMTSRCTAAPSFRRSRNGRFLRPARMPRVDELPVPAQNQIRASRGEEAGLDLLHDTQRLATVGFGRKDEVAPVHAPLEPPPQAHRRNHEAPRQAASPVHAEYAKRNGRSAGLGQSCPGSARSARPHAPPAAVRGGRSARDTGLPGELTLRSLPK